MLLASQIGFGYGQFIDIVGDFGGPSYLQAHNTQVKVAAESGWVGIFSYLGLIFLTLKHMIVMENYFKRVAILEPMLIIQGLRISLIGFLVNTSFSVKEHEWMLYIVLGLSLAMREIYRKTLPLET